MDKQKTFANVSQLSLQFSLIFNFFIVQFHRISICFISFPQDVSANCPLNFCLLGWVLNPKVLIFVNTRPSLFKLVFALAFFFSHIHYCLRIQLMCMDEPSVDL